MKSGQKRKIKCPNNYGHYDQMTVDCQKCNKAKLYQRCSKDTEEYKEHLACAGWNDNKGSPYCCGCYGEEK